MIIHLVRSPSQLVTTLCGLPVKRGMAVTDSLKNVSCEQCRLVYLDVGLEPAVPADPTPVMLEIPRLLFKENAPAGMNPLVVMSLAYFYRSNVLHAEPIEVTREGDNFRIQDGRHRTVGSLIAGRNTVLGIIKE